MPIGTMYKLLKIKSLEWTGGNKNEIIGFASRNNIEIIFEGDKLYRRMVDRYIPVDIGTCIFHTGEFYLKNIDEVKEIVEELIKEE